MTNQVTNIRYVHEQNAFTRFTVAYTRTDKSIVFAWSKVNPKDQYVKKIGREVSTERLIKNFDELTSKYEFFFIDPETHSGIIFVDDLMDTSFLIEEVIKNISVWSFRHWAISDVLRDIVETKIPIHENLGKSVKYVG